MLQKSLLIGAMTCTSRAHQQQWAMYIYLYRHGPSFVVVHVGIGAATGEVSLNG